MIEQALNKIPYVKNLETQMQKYRVLASLRQDTITDLNQENQDLKNQLIGCKAKIRELKGNQEILEFNLQKRDKEIEELQKELSYYKKALKRVYQGNHHISVEVSREIKK